MSTIYIRTTGNDTAGNGSENSPYLTAQKAFEVAYVNNGDYILDFGVGNFGGVDLNTANANEWPDRIQVRGVNITNSLLGGINGNGINSDNGKNISIFSNFSVNLGNIISNGGTDGGNGGNITLKNSRCGNITTNGGTNGFGGNVSLANSNSLDIETTGSHGGLVTLAGSSIIPSSITGASAIDMNGLSKGYGSFGSSVLGLANKNTGTFYTCNGYIMEEAYIDDDGLHFTGYVPDPYSGGWPPTSWVCPGIIYGPEGITYNNMTAVYFNPDAEPSKQYNIKNEGYEASLYYSSVNGVVYIWSGG